MTFDTSTQYLWTAERTNSLFIQTAQMRCSVILTVLAILEHVAYGFSLPGRRLSRPCPPTSGRGDPVTTTLTQLRGGGGTTTGWLSKLKATSSSESETSTPAVTSVTTAVTSLWGTVGVLYILAKAIKRVVPIALEPFQDSTAALSQLELGAYIVTCIWFAYVEGYKGFQQKFSPLVVKRSFTLNPGTNGVSWWHVVLAPMYSMGLVHATKKRKIVSWSVTLGVAAIVAAVKRLPYPWRNIVDAGVVVGLTWGSLSIVVSYLHAIVTGKAPCQVSAELPTSSTD